MTGLLSLLACADGLLVLFGDVSHGWLPIFVAFLSILLVGLALCSQLM